MCDELFTKVNGLSMCFELFSHLLNVQFIYQIFVSMITIMVQVVVGKNVLPGSFREFSNEMDVKATSMVCCCQQTGLHKVNKIIFFLFVFELCWSVITFGTSQEYSMPSPASSGCVLVDRLTMLPSVYARCWSEESSFWKSWHSARTSPYTLLVSDPLSSSLFLIFAM